MADPPPGCDGQMHDHTVLLKEMTRIPKRIVCFWHKHPDVPPFVRACLDNIALLHPAPDWTLHILSATHPGFTARVGPAAERPGPSERPSGRGDQSLGFFWPRTFWRPSGFNIARTGSGCGLCRGLPASPSRPLAIFFLSGNLYPSRTNTHLHPVKSHPCQNGAVFMKRPSPAP